MSGGDLRSSSSTRKDATRSEWISAAEAAEIVGVDRGQMYRLMAKDRIPTYGDPHSYNQIRRRDAEELRDLGERIPLSEAARILRHPIQFVRELAAAGEIRFWPGSLRPVFRSEIEQFAASLPPVSSSRPARNSRLSTGAVAERLGLSRSRVYGLARQGLLPAVQDKAGRYWVDEHHLGLYLRAKQAEAEAETLLPPSYGSSRAESGPFAPARPRRGRATSRRSAG
jgi:predicted DNA-binding transcriptional regulator AlpA